MKTEEQPNIVLAEKIEIRELECAGECLYECKCAFMNVCVCVYVCVCVWEKVCEREREKW